ncbi:MAG: phosphoribosylamine--glycine ligase [Rickettsiales bacterium]|jgi:phosphoribosylamine--glycine ligase|nr:phosphoribosylamine--glycine ligase [Rickettsiales bacterium]
MKILVIGSGGREHAICQKFHQDGHKVYCAPGNGGTAQVAENVAIHADEFELLTEFASHRRVDFTLVGPEVPLAAGIADFFQARGMPVFAPNKRAAQLESSKTFSKNFLRRHGIATAAYDSFGTLDGAMKHLESWPEDKKAVVKADGLAAGKGVFICDGRDQARDAARQIMGGRIFGEQGRRVVIEEFLKGEELSVLMFTDGETYSIMPPAQDHKRVYDNDAGPNTGGMGAYAPAPLATKELMEKVRTDVIEKTMAGMKADKIDFKGVLYAGLMVSDGAPYVLEFNTRFGDPETQAILPLLKTDLLSICRAVVRGKLKDIDIEWHDKAAVSVVMASGGYPGAFKTGYEIGGLSDLTDGCAAYHAGTTADGGKILTAGGRVLNITATGDDIGAAVRAAYLNVAKVKFHDAHFRKDIAARALGR